MKFDIKLPAAIALLTPLTAFAASEGGPEVFLFALVGGAVGGVVGALVGSLVASRRDSKDDRDPKP